LDKISKSGYDSLDDDDKEYLFKQGGEKWKNLVFLKSSFF
jgi:hypothetical protein